MDEVARLVKILHSYQNCRDQDGQEDCDEGKGRHKKVTH